MSETVYSEQPAPATTAVSLSLNDLKICLQIIDLCSQRGAFKPEEFQAVGTIHQKLRLFLEQSEQATKAAETQPEETNDD